MGDLRGGVNNFAFLLVKFFEILLYNVQKDILWQMRVTSTEHYD